MKWIHETMLSAVHINTASLKALENLTHKLKLKLYFLAIKQFNIFQCFFVQIVSLQLSSTTFSSQWAINIK